MFCRKTFKYFDVNVTVITYLHLKGEKREKKFIHIDLRHMKDLQTRKYFIA